MPCRGALSRVRVSESVRFGPSFKVSAIPLLKIAGLGASWYPGRLAASKRTLPAAVMSQSFPLAVPGVPGSGPGEEHP